MIRERCGKTKLVRTKWSKVAPKARHKNRYFVYTLKSNMYLDQLTVSNKKLMLGENSIEFLEKHGSRFLLVEELPNG